jgi:hypothetical protein
MVMTRATVSQSSPRRIARKGSQLEPERGTEAVAGVRRTASMLTTSGATQETSPTANTGMKGTSNSDFLTDILQP